jgi:hypothetical protein
LHHSLYLQLLPHVLDYYQLLIDLHTGSDLLSPSVDLICADAALCARLEAAIPNNAYSFAILSGDSQGRLAIMNGCT